MCDMYDICVMCDVCENCADSSRVTYVTHIACSARETSIAHIPHRICVTFESGAIRDSFAKRLFEQSEFGAPCLALVQPCRSAGVAPADGRRQPLPTGPRPAPAGPRGPPPPRAAPSPSRRARKPRISTLAPPLSSELCRLQPRGNMEC